MISYGEVFFLARLTGLSAQRVGPPFTAGEGVSWILSPVHGAFREAV
jgi:hypothetical protein